jgi:sodium transport system permease protein
VKRLRQVQLTLGKELRETLRDRRTLAMMVLLPLVVYPLLSLLGTQVMTARTRQQRERPSAVAVAGPAAVRADVERRLSARPETFSVQAEGTAADVQAGRIDALVRPKPPEAPTPVPTPGAPPPTGAAPPTGVPPTTGVPSPPGEAPPPGAVPAPLELVFDATRDESRQAEERLSEALSCALPNDQRPLYQLSRRDLATKDEVGGYLLSKILPLVVVLMVLLGAFYPAIDVTAGERERGTLETVLASPIRRTDLLLGKVLAVTILATLTGLLNLASMSLTLVQMVRLAEAGAAVPVPWGRAGATALVVVPTAFLFGALFVAIGSLARSFKEAQNLLLPAYFLVFAPAMIGAMGELPLEGLLTAVPGMNVTLLAREIALGKATLPATLAVLGSTLVYGLLALGFAARLYASERFLDLAGRAPRGGGDAAGGARADAPPVGAGEALALFAIGYVLLYFVFAPLQRRDLTLGLLASQYGGLLGLTLLFARLTHRPPRAVLPLGRPPLRALGGAALAGLSAWVVAGLLTEWIAPPPKELLEALRRHILGAEARGYLPTLLLVALTPALCEEAFFRGPLLQGLLTRLAPPGAIVVNGLLFGVFHMDLYRLLPTTLLGILLATLRYRTGSLWAPALAHFLNNGTLVTLAHLGLEDRVERLSGAAQAGIFGAGALVLAAGLGLAGGRSAQRQSVG